MRRKTQNVRRIAWLFTPHPDAKQRWRSALRLLDAIACAKFVSEKLKRKMLRIAVYELTEIHGKHNLRYKSSRCETARRSNVQHEHVIARKELVDEMLKHPKQVKRIAKRAVACLVTTGEHRRLLRKGNGLTGWKRYKAAKIEVIDTSTGKRLSL